MANYNVYIGMPAYDQYYVRTLKNVTKNKANNYTRDLTHNKYKSYTNWHDFSPIMNFRNEFFLSYGNYT